MPRLHSVSSARKAYYSVFELALPGRPAFAVGIALLDPLKDRLEARFRQDWEAIAPAEEVELLSQLEHDLNARARQTGGEKLLAELEDCLSNTLRICERSSIAISDFDRALERLFLENVAFGKRSRRSGGLERPVPVYSLRAAATKFGEDMEVEPEGWVEAPGNLRDTTYIYGVRVVGRSMEPLIPDGSLALFRHPVVGSRQGKILLIWQRGASETGGEFTVKRYTSSKVVTGEGWKHSRIRLEPLNPEFEAWDLEPAELDEGPRYRSLGEFVQVVPYEDE